MPFTDSLTAPNHDMACPPPAVEMRADPRPDPGWAFGMAGPQVRLFATGLRRRLPAGPIATLGERTRRFLAGLPAASRLVGALPFDREAEDALFLPDSVSELGWPFALPEGAPAAHWRVTAEPGRAAYAAAVARALEALAAGGALTKAVLSRSLRLEAEAAVDPLALWRNLQADEAATRFLVPLGPGAGGAMRRLVGATPELLVSRQGARVVSHPLAGSARRSADAAADAAAAQALLASEKDRREHALVVEAILDLLAPLCAGIAAPGAPALVSTRSMWHLGTRIEARLRDPTATTAADLAALLHPTPAVAGTPRREALDLIRALEGHDRGFYAGAVGWTDAAGDGAWHVALRCAEVEGRTVRAFAGAGIVAGSDPQAEVEETAGKLQAILRALGVNEQGGALPAAG